jgi:hypothetical protein
MPEEGAPLARDGPPEDGTPSAHHDEAGGFAHGAETKNPRTPGLH